MEGDAEKGDAEPGSPMCSVSAQARLGALTHSRARDPHASTSVRMQIETSAFPMQSAGLGMLMRTFQRHAHAPRNPIFGTTISRNAVSWSGLFGV